MKRTAARLMAGLFSIAVVLTGVSQPASALAPRVTKKLLWSAEFNGKAGQKPGAFGFVHDIGYSNGWGNSEVEYYTNRKSNASTDGNGNMVITARRLAFEDPLNVKYCGLGCEYSSARFHTSGKLRFQYGRMEARIKLPAGQGTWPAFWMLGTDLGKVGWPNSGEIDIMEGKGAASTMLWGTIHGPGYSGGNCISNQVMLDSPLSDGYHTYAIEWRKNSIEWFVDGTSYAVLTPASLSGRQWVFNKPFFVILNLAMGGMFGGETDPDVTIARMSIDYVRYYKLGNDGLLKRF